VKAICLMVAAIGMSMAACASAASPQTTTLVVYVTPGPTPIVIYVTPAPTALPTPSSAPTPAPTAPPPQAKTPKPKPTSTPVSASRKAYEHLIEAHIPGSFSSQCEPKRDSLPPNALAGIECTLNSGPVKLVGYYLFDSKTAMDAAYFNRLAEYGVAPGSGQCSQGVAGDGQWAYAGDFYAEGRLGCFVNENGNANLRWTHDEFSIYAGIVGRGYDIARAYDWWSAAAGPFDIP
jgi:hypothetical protein